MPDYRIEKDSFGEVQVPKEALYGAQTQRAVENFPISGIRFPRAFIRSLGIIKSSAALTNMELGLLTTEKGRALQAAASEVAEGRWDAEFPLDIFQTGSGTSTNMNANEVISTLANMAIAAKQSPERVHPNDDVNMGQSSNDVIPSAIHISSALLLRELLLPSLSLLHDTLQSRAGEFMSVVKTGRTHLMDAMPLALGQEINGWAYQVSQARARLQACMPELMKLALGGTAVGTGINAHPEFGKRTAAKIAEMTGLPFVEADNHYAAQASMDAITGLSGQLKTTASALMKIANDLRLMNSGPVAGLAEISLPALQPGSSIMPGKVNPVICEALIMVCAQVIGNDIAVTTGNSRGEFELNVMLPLIARNVLESITVLANAARVFAENAVSGFTVNKERISDLLGRNPILATTLVAAVGYERTAEIVKKAHAEGKSIREVAAAMTGLQAAELERLLDPKAMTGEGLRE